MTPPLIVRVAGLPAEVVDSFSHRRLLDALVESGRLRERLGRARAALVDCLHGAVRTDDRDERRFLLSVKRSCFNGGDLKVFQRDRRWSFVVGIASAMIDEVLTLEGAVEEAEATFEELYCRALRRERESIVQLLENRAFVRGVALASPEVARNLDRLKGRNPDSFGRRENRLCLTLLRYASRAALKLSPFSTLTRTGLAATGDAPEGFAFLPGAAWRERSTISLRRELLEQCSCLLLRCDGFVEGLQVTVNETLVCEADGIYTFFRPGRWEFEDGSKAFRYLEPSSVRASLEGPLVPWLLSDLREGPQVYRHLKERAQTAFDAEDFDSVVKGIDGLIGIGFLSLVLPWSFSEPDLEQKIVKYAGALSETVGLEDFRNRLRDLISLLGRYAEADSPAQLLSQSKKGVENLFRALVPPAGIDPRIEFNAQENTFEEDVFLLPGPGRAERPELASLSRERMGALLVELEPLARLIDLHDSNRDLLQTLAAFGQRRWPDTRDIGLLDFFSAALPIFNEYLRYRTNLRAKPTPIAPGFNPLGLESVRSLNRWRRLVEEGLAGCFSHAGTAHHLCPRSLSDLLDQVPGFDARSCAFCAFVQPLDTEGRLWVLNSIKDGFGRFGSRFTAGMDDETRGYWTTSFTPLSFLDLGGERVELVDLTCPGRRTINVHIHQTCRMLKMPGEHIEVAPERLIRLSDLRVRLRGMDHAPVLTDTAGQRLLPVPLGSLAAEGWPTLLKFLAIFGPGDFRRPLPGRAPRVEDGVEVIDRHLLGQIVYLRKKWRLQPRQLLSIIEGCGEASAFAAVNRWRLSLGIPDLVFVQEAIFLGSNFRRKPQYIDFSSPSFLQMFRSILTKDLRSLVIEEALPTPEQSPIREHRWAAEVQLESFAFQRDHNPPVLHERKKQQPAWQA